LRLGAWQVAELLTTDCVERPEDHDLAVLVSLHHRFQTGAQCQRRLARARASSERHDADLGVEQEVERDPLLGAAAMNAERITVATDQPHLFVWRDPAE